MISNVERVQKLKNAIASKGCIRVLEAHSPISALLSERIQVLNLDGDHVGFDAVWSSSLTDSTFRGLPDIELISVDARLKKITDIFNVCSLPLIYDGDTGGKIEHFSFHVGDLERAGVSAVVIEDKCGLKRNSLFGNDVLQTQDSVEHFSEKIRVGCAARSNKDFMVIARCESLILDKGMNDALERCFAYVDAGADSIMIHSRKKSGEEVIEFADAFRKDCPNIPLMCVPTSYTQLTFEELRDAGFNIVIYANHMFRSSYLAMKTVAEQILRHGRTSEVEPSCLAIEDILHLIPAAI